MSHLYYFHINLKLQKLQSALTQYCKTGIWEESLGPVPARAAIYREMVQHNFNAALSKAYPITRQSLGEDLWARFTGLFLQHYAQAEAHYPELPKALSDFEQAEAWGAKQGISWLAELLEFEWTQVALFQKPDTANIVSVGFSGDLNQPLLLHPDWELLQVSYPFYRKDWQEAPGDYFLLLYRSPQTLQVENLELNPFLAAFWLALFGSPDLPVSDVLSHLLQEYQIDMTEAVLVACRGFLGEMGERGLLLG